MDEKPEPLVRESTVQQAHSGDSRVGQCKWLRLVHYFLSTIDHMFGRCQVQGNLLAELSHLTFCGTAEGRMLWANRIFRTLSGGNLLKRYLLNQRIQRKNTDHIGYKLRNVPMR